MSEQKTMQQAELPTLESAPGEKHSAVIARGISMPAHQVRIAIEQAVARGQVSTERRSGGCTTTPRKTTSRKPTSPPR